MLQQKLLADELNEAGSPLGLASCSFETRNLHFKLKTALFPTARMISKHVAEDLTQLA